MDYSKCDIPGPSYVHPLAEPLPPPGPFSCSMTKSASLRVTSCRESSSFCGLFCVLVLDETYGLAHPPLVAVVFVAGAVVVAGDSPDAVLVAVAAGLGLGGGVDVFAAFIQAYLPVPKPAA